jgi:hypothetical protein
MAESAEFKSGEIVPANARREIDEIRELARTPIVGCEVPAIVHEQVPKMEVAEASSRDNNKRVEDARRARVARLEKLRRECASEEEYDTARTQSMRTEVDDTAFTTASSKELDSTSSSSCLQDGPSPADSERMREEDRLHFQHLQSEESPSFRGIRTKILPEYDAFFVDFGGRLEAGQKIGGGGQADIHEAILDGQPTTQWVLKVFRSDYSLADLQRSWVKDIAEISRLDAPYGLPYGNCCIVVHGTILQCGRFAFVLERCWGDLRKAIDSIIVKDKTHGLGNYLVADFDSPMGVVGTGFWRAPEVLLAVKNRVSDLHSNQEIWTKKVDVYSYAMTCYEVLTGCIPFEGHEQNDYDGVIGGERPPLPNYVNPRLQELLKRCWHCEPSIRPNFRDIVFELRDIFPSSSSIWDKENFIDTVFDKDKRERDNQAYDRVEYGVR